MTRDQLKKAIDDLPDARVPLMTLVEQSALEAHVRQANAADAKVETLAKEHDERHREREERHTAEVARVREEHATALGQVHADHAETLVSLRAERDALAVQLAGAQKIITACGGMETMQEFARQAELAQAEKAHAELVARIKNLRGE